MAETFSATRPARDTTAALACRLRPGPAAAMAALGRAVLGRTLPARARGLWSAQLLLDAGHRLGRRLSDPGYAAAKSGPRARFEFRGHSAASKKEQ